MGTRAQEEDDQCYKQKYNVENIRHDHCFNLLNLSVDIKQILSGFWLLVKGDMQHKHQSLYARKRWWMDIDCNDWLQV